MSKHGREHPDSDDSFAAQITTDIRLPRDTEGASDLSVLQSLPTARGVILFETEDSRPIMVAISASVREFVQRRLSPLPEGTTSRPAADITPLTHRIRVASVGSAFEAEWVYLRIVRSLFPDSYRAFTERWTGWFIQIDPLAEHPQWTKVSSSKLADDRAPVSGRYLGPIADKNAAGRYIELLDDLFDLCRDYRLLVRSPHAKACPYKEMGKCPAPCDGSETLDEYRARIARAIEFAARGTAAWKADLGDRMQLAAHEQRFEEAAMLKSQIDRCSQAEKPSLRHCRVLTEFNWLFVLPSERSGWLRIVIASQGRVFTLADVVSEVGDQTVLDLLPAIGRSIGPPEPPPYDRRAADTIGLISRWVYKLKTSQGTVMRLSHQDLEPTNTSICEAIRTTARQLSKRRASDSGDGQDEYAPAIPTTTSDSQSSIDQ